MNAAGLCLLAEGALRTTFEWGRIQSPADWLVPAAVCALLLVFVGYMYRRDSVDLSPLVGAILTALRMSAFLGLLVIYLQPQWRNERDLVSHSRVPLLVDTSLSMGLHDSDASPVPAEPSRAQQVVAVLAEGGFLTQLRRRHDVVVARFDQDLSRVLALGKLPPGGAAPAPAPPAAPAASEAAVDWLEALGPRGAETRLGQALRQLIDEERTAPVSGIVVFTDGQQNAGLDPAAAVRAAREARIPIYPVGIGSVEQPANVRISDLVAPARTYPGDSYAATGYLQAQGLAGRTVTVELFSRTAGGRAANDSAGQIEASDQVTLGGDGEVVPVRFELTPSEVGRRTLLVRVKPPPEDHHAGDDQQEVDIEVVDRKSRVLLFAGGASREYQFLRNQLRRDRDVVVDVLLQTGSEGISQDANEILDEFPASREELYSYDCLVAFDPDWRELDAVHTDLLERWVGDQAGGLIVIAGPIHTDGWTQDLAMGAIRNLYPVEFHRRFSLLDDAQYGSKEPWPIEFTREGLEAEFLWLEDSAAASARAWSDFAGVYGHYAVRGPKPGATVYGRFSDPRAAEGDQKPVYLAGQFFGSGRVLYLGSGEMWRLRAYDAAYFERLYTKLVRFVSQGRLLRGSTRGILLAERDRYLLGNTVDIRAQLTDQRLEPLELASVPLEVVLPDSTLQSVMLAADASRPGSYRGQFTVRKEGVYRLELPVPLSEDERLARRIQVRVPDLERENPTRNDALLSEIAQQTGGVYYNGLEAALGRRAGVPPLVDRLRDQSRTETRPAQPTPLWDKAWVMYLLCGVLCLEWLVRRLAKLA